MAGLNTSLQNMPQSRKAAMVVQLLLREGDDLSLSDLPDAAQARLTKELGALNMIDRKTLNSVAEEFAEALANVGLTPPGSIEAALLSLDGRISPATAARLRDEAAGIIGSDPWAMVLRLDPEKMVPITEAESFEVSAILLSKLPTRQAATLLGLIPGDRARKIAYAMSKTTAIRNDAIVRIGKGLAQQYCGAALPAFSETAESRIGAILNSSPAATRDEILQGLLTQDQVFGEGVRKKIFTFADIPARLAMIDVPKILRDIGSSDIVIALASAIEAGGALKDAAEFMLDNMSKRMAEGLREEISETGKIKQSDAELAQMAVIAAIRTAVDAGTIKLISSDEEA